MAKALPVLNLNERSFEIDAEAFKSVLAKVGNRRFSLISINGPTRTGKSYTLSHFVRYFESKKKDSNSSNWFDINNASCSEFTWRGGMDRTTTGIDLWSEPYFVKTPQGEEIAVLLLDTQGLFDPETSARQNAIIFSISTLCSSTMIFNIKGMVEENILQQVEFFSGYAHMAPVNQEKDSNCALGTNILFLLRDFELQGFELGHHESKTVSQENDAQNLYCKIFNLEGRQNCPEENKIVRQNILRNFQDVSVYCLPHPGKKFLRTNNPGVNTSPDDDFKDGFIAFVESMVQPGRLVIKTVLGHPTTGLEFQKYINLWANMCKDAQDIFPDVLTLAENTSFIQYSIALNLAVSKYKDDMDTFVMANSGSISEEEFEKLHYKLFEAAKAIFLNAKMKINPRFEEKFMLDLTTNIECCYQFAKECNEQYRQIIANNEENEKVLAQKMQEMECRTAEKRKKMNRLVRGFQNSEETHKREMEESQTRMDKLRKENQELTSADNKETMALTLEAIKTAVGVYQMAAPHFSNKMDSKSLREENKRLQCENVKKEKEKEETLHENRKLRKDNERLRCKIEEKEGKEESGCRIV